MRKTTLTSGQLLRSVHMKKVTSARRITWCCTTVDRPLEVTPGRRKTHVNSYRHQTTHRGKVGPGVSELPLPGDYLNSPLLNESGAKSLNKQLLTVPMRPEDVHVSNLLHTLCLLSLL